MEYTRATARAMHDDHMAVNALLDRVERFVEQHGSDDIPDHTRPEVGQLLSELRAAVEGEITSHFSFEEESLFPILEEAGAGDMCAILRRDNQVLLPQGMRLAEIAGPAGRSGFTAESWSEFRRDALTFADGLRGHANKEEMGMVPALEELLEEDQDRDLIARYRFT